MNTLLPHIQRSAIAKYTILINKNSNYNKFKLNVISWYPAFLTIITTQGKMSRQ